MKTETKRKQMKRSSHSSCSSSSSTCSTFSSSSSSCEGSKSKSYVPNHEESQPEKPKSKRAKKTNNNNNKSQDKCQNAASPSSSRRSSIYRGVTRHRWTGRFEAHLWDKSSWNNVQNKKGRQVYLGAYDNEEAAARTYDLAALKYWGPETILNFPIETYTKELVEMQIVTKEEYLASLRRRSSGFSRGVSKYRGVARHHHNGRWEARIGRVFGNKYLYLGTYNTQEEAAAAYDMAAIEYRGPNAVTNFDISNYIDRLKKKGIPLDNIFKEPTVADSSVNESELAQVEELPKPLRLPSQPLSQSEQQLQQQKQWQEIVAAPLHCPQFSHCVDTSMDPINEHDIDWSFCLDVGLTSLQMLELPIESSCELPDLFNNAGFEDNIDLIFETCPYGNMVEANQTEYVSDNSGCGVEEAGVSGSMEVENGKDSLLFAASSSNSPACSTTTSVSCN